MKKLFLVFNMALILYTQESLSNCKIKNSDGSVTSIKSDALYTLLERSQLCPENVQSLKALFINAGNKLKPSMVANRGIHNPDLGSFSFFEEIVNYSNQNIQAGELFLGHFTSLVDGLIVLDQKPAPQKLMIELIAWDHQKKYFNFYELIGHATGAQWFYRGDSADILQDNKNLYLDVQVGSTQFGKILRCSACHTSGGPIMKEISFPHNDWWVDSRPLYFGKNKLSLEVSQIVSELFDAADFSQSVKKGINKLESSENYKNLKAKMPLQIQLRPLFCEMEINLESDSTPLLSAIDKVQVPSSSVISPFLGQAHLEISKMAYFNLLDIFKINFPETAYKDADHGWLVPVKGYSDIMAIKMLIKTNVITEEFAADVLAIDIQTPLFSTKRCKLLKMFPNSGDIMNFIENLKSSNLPEAQELYQNLTDSKKNKNFYAERAIEILAQTQLQLNTRQDQKKYFENLIFQRQSVFESVISKNPRGQILEPGFRVIFPVPQ